MIAHFNIGAHRYAVPLPRGVEGLRLYESVSLLADRIDLWAVEAAVWAPEKSAAMLRAVNRLAHTPGAKDAIEETLDGGEVDGVLYCRGMWAGVWATPGRFAEPYRAAMEVWKQAGFFGDAPEAAPAEQPASDPPDESPSATG